MILIELSLNSLIQLAAELWCGSGSSHMVELAGADDCTALQCPVCRLPVYIVKWTLVQCRWNRRRYTHHFTAAAAAAVDNDDSDNDACGWFTRYWRNCFSSLSASPLPPSLALCLCGAQMLPVRSIVLSDSWAYIRSLRLCNFLRCSVAVLLIDSPLITVDRSARWCVVSTPPRCWWCWQALAASSPSLPVLSPHL